MVSSMATWRRRLAQGTAHLVVGVVALVVIGGATRVMEAASLVRTGLFAMALFAQRADEHSGFS